MVVKHKHRFLLGLLLINLTLYAQNPPPTYLSAIPGDEAVDLAWQPPGTVYTEGESCSFPFSGGLLTNEFSQVFEGSTDGFDNDYSNGFAAGGGDVVFQFTVENDVAVTFSLCETLDWDTYLLLFDATCENLLTFDDDGCSGANGFASEITATLGSGTYHLVVDGYGATSFGAYTLSVSGSAATTSAGSFSEGFTDPSKLDDRDLTGSSINAVSSYNPGLEQTLEFSISVVSPDNEWVDGFSLTFPEGWQTVSGQMEGGQLDAQVDGNLITFGDPYLGSGFGALNPPNAEYPFEVTLIAPDGGGDVTVNYYIGGEELFTESVGIPNKLYCAESNDDRAKDACFKEVGGAFGFPKKKGKTDWGKTNCVRRKGKKDGRFFDRKRRRDKRGKNRFSNKKRDNQDRQHKKRNKKGGGSFSLKKKFNAKKKGFKKKFFNKKKRFSGKR